jgi:nitrogenase molybdenum-iron protein alpha chain
MMETKYGTPWLKVNFHRHRIDEHSLRQMARCFGDEELVRKTEEVIERETARVGPILDQYRKVLQGKTAFAIVGGSAGATTTSTSSATSAWR